MRQLVIEYGLEGHRRGYDFSTPTDGYSDSDLKLIWRSAMPRGQGWSRYIGARSIKTFPLEGSRRITVCETAVTDLRDEHGRGGIRRVVIDVLPRADYFAWLRQRLDHLPDAVRVQVDRLPTFTQRLAINNRIMTHRNNQLVLLHPYDAPERWRVIEGLVMKLALSPPGALRSRSEIVPFTTLALGHHDESLLVAMPAEKEAAVDKRTPFLRV